MLLYTVAVAIINFEVTGCGAVPAIHV